MKDTFATALIAALVPLSAAALSGHLSAEPSGPSASAPFEPGEDRPGGMATATVSPATREAFSQPSQGIGLDGESRFNMGKAIFERQWTTAPSSTTSADGLGPLYNARACQNCHVRDGRGHPPAKEWPAEDAVSLLLRVSIPPQTEAHTKLLDEKRILAVPDPTYGLQLQSAAIKGLDAEGHLLVTYEEKPVTLGDGTVVSLRRPTYSVADLGYGPLNRKVMLSPRVAPQMIGLGLLEAIPEADIRAGADHTDKNKDGISGHANEVWSAEKARPVLGRFGWKAGAPSVREQSADAAFFDIGLSSALHPSGSGECTGAEGLCLKAPTGDGGASGGHELSDELLDLVVFYSENVAVPQRREPKAPQVLLGKGIFQTTGCADCHTPSFKTGEVDGQPHLSHQTIWPYTDLLLHDMGEGLADHRPEGLASGTDWRTAPLWGIGLTETVSGHTFLLHDGRARSLEEAILWHGGEADAARRAYMSLSKPEREALLAFVGSL